MTVLQGFYSLGAYDGQQQRSKQMFDSRDELFVVGAWLVASFSTDDAGRRTLRACSGAIRRNGGTVETLNTIHGTLSARFTGDRADVVAENVERFTGRYAGIVGASATVVTAPVVKLF